MLSKSSPRWSGITPRGGTWRRRALMRDLVEHTLRGKHEARILVEYLRPASRYCPEPSRTALADYLTRRRCRAPSLRSGEKRAA